MTATRASACPDDDTLAALVAGQLVLDQHPELEAHLADCASCQCAVAAAADGNDASSAARIVAGSAGFEDTQLVPTGLSRGMPQPGDVLAGKYELEKVIGRGAMSTVYAARHGKLGQRVAIKVLQSAAPSAAERFLQEARISAQLRSEHTAKVFDLGSTSTGVPFLVMEHLVGEDLAHALRRGPLSPASSVQYALHICTALSEAHAAGVIHRDLKPSNLFLTRRSDDSECIKVLDFGISKRITVEGGDESPSLTQTNSFIGSPAYMSPEQLRESKDVDLRTDIWSLGVVLYELLTGERPFKATRLSALSASIAADQPPPPIELNPAVPTALSEIVMRCLRKRADERFASTSELALTLRQSLEAPMPAVPAKRPKRWLPLAVVSLAIGTLALSMSRGQRTASESTLPLKPTLPASALPAAAPPDVTIDCDTPYPVGLLRIYGQSAANVAGVAHDFTVHSLCDPAGASRAELARVLHDSTPLRAELDPPHPFYRVELDGGAATPTVRLRRAERTSVSLTLSGAGCEHVRKLELVAADTSGTTYVAAGAGCQCVLDLPFEAFGKTFRLRVTPATYDASNVDFDSAVVVAALQRRVSESAPRPAQRKPCVPPEYCRD